jgi:hypothetical protein
MSNNKAVQILVVVVLLTLIFAIARQLSERRSIYLFPDSWGKFFSWYGQEGFADGAGDATHGVQDVPGLLSPAEAKAPYQLLADVKNPKKRAEKTLTAKTCYEADFLAQSSKVGNYIQRTNNFVHGDAESCSAPRTELVTAFYN